MKDKRGKCKMKNKEAEIKLNIRLSRETVLTSRSEDYIDKLAKSINKVIDNVQERQKECSEKIHCTLDVEL